MKKNIIRLIVFLVPAIIISLHTAQAEVAIVVHKDNGATFTDKQLEHIFLMKANQFPDGEAAKIVIPSDEPKLMEEFAKKVCNRKGHQVQATWKKMLFTGKGKPVKVDNDSAVIEKVSSNSQYIGVVDAANTSDAVKVVKTF